MAADLSPRAQAVLGAVDLILAEDTRHSRRMLTHFGIHIPLLAYHGHNERRLCAGLVERLASGESIGPHLRFPAPQSSAIPGSISLKRCTGPVFG